MLIFKHRRTYFANLVEGELELGTIGEVFFLFFKKKTRMGKGYWELLEMLLSQYGR